jgi:adenylosuccinate synthase
MSATRYASVLGLGFGDCGKGRFVDALTRRWQAHTVARFNGGAQAGHNVVDEARHHTFSQFGSGTFVPGVATLLLDPVIVHPTALLVEAEALGRIGVNDAIARLKIDQQCKVTTPYHQAAGRLRELLRGVKAHGTCGVGVGETVRHSLAHPAEVICYGDLPVAPMEKLMAARATLLAELSPQCEGIAACRDELAVLRDETLGQRWMLSARSLARSCRPASVDEIAEALHKPGSVMFEGAQGILLDEWRGFHPHTTWSSTTTAAVESVASRFGITGGIEHYGVLRSYLTRHGTGPLPTHDASLDALPEPHNSGHGWQGTFRRGHPDAVLLRYALEAVGILNGLLVSHLDIFDRGIALKWCESYTNLSQLPVSQGQDLAHQSALTGLLADAGAIFSGEPICTADALLARIASVTPIAVAFGSFAASAELEERP